MKRNWSLYAALLVAIAYPLTGCGGDDGDPDMDAGTDAASDSNINVPDTMTPDTMTPDTMTPDTMTPDTMDPPVTDGNDTPGEAEVLDFMGMEGVNLTGAAIDAPGDLDHYRVTFPANTWFIVQTDANAEDDPEKLDAVLTLMDGEGTKIAENDDRIPRINTDAEIVYYTEAGGDFIIKVEEWTTWEGSMPAEGGPTFTYDLLVGALNPEAEVVNAEVESGNEVANAQAMTFAVPMGTTAQISTVHGRFDAPSDVDYFSFTVADGEPSLADGLVIPVGPDANGSTALPATISITSADGSDTIATITPRADETMGTPIQPALPAGEYLLKVTGPADAGANGFYSIRFNQFGDNPSEAMETENNDAATPEALELVPPMDESTLTRAFVTATMATPDDVDHFSVMVPAAQELFATCGSLSDGSGVSGLTLEVLGPDGASLGTGMETITEGAQVGPLEMTAAGNHIIKLTRGSQSVGISGDWVRCGVVFGPPAP